ncbi:hypothetical protein N7492_000538 [Penicillium capsulatum]|uniref:Chromatin assembly factor 1 subunit A n=1 Tax=Penicillium capsulatum TaxID=69766 RepID=A0A9W9IS34_9EURO|nr:hypothetical protein N7492_000538 [Penicillium capsulatum]KAJ6130403.1 hypothetical protein N7512_003183 [Penicillium capsulatum]
MSLSPLPPSSTIPVSSSEGPRKRSIHEVDDAAVQSLGAKKPLTVFAGENQENKDPSLVDASKDTPLVSEGTVPFPASNVEDQVKQSALNSGSESTPTPNVEMADAQSNHIPAPNQGSPSKSDTTSSPTSKQKLSAASKEAKQQEKETKERQRLEEKRKKDEEKARKEEEKRLKANEKKKREAEREEEKRVKEEDKKKREAEREEKKKAKEEEKAAKEAAKEDEKRRKEEEKLKKERVGAPSLSLLVALVLTCPSQAQPKLNSFFTKPQIPSTAAIPTHPSSPSKSSLAGDNSSAKASEPQSDYAKAFPDFYLQSHTTVAPAHRFERDSQSLQHVRHTLDEGMKANTSDPAPFRPSEIFRLIPYQRRRGRQVCSVKEILQRIQSAEGAVLPGSSLKSESTETPLDLLRRVKMKSLKFGEDVRPPYQGTFTRPVSPNTATKIARNPYRRTLPETNYDYDSEAEWEEPEEGEDLDSEEEEEEGDDGDDDMDGFLDDEDDALAGGKRRLIVGDLEPVCTGIQWAADGVTEDLKPYGMQTISDAVKLPIDPFSTVYWQKPRAADPGPGKNVPHRPQTLDMYRASGGPDAPAVGGALPPKAKRPFPPEHLGEFKEIVDGNDLSRIGVVEILKKRFPKVSKETLKATLDQVAVRVGQKEADKKWVCR